VQSIVPQHLFDGAELLHRLRLVLGQVLRLLFLLAAGKSILMFHDSWSGGFLKVQGEGFPGAMKLAPDSVGGLFRESGHLVITHLLIGHEQEQQTVFIRQGIKRFLNALPEFLCFQHTQGRIGFRRCAVPDEIVRIGNHVSLMPGLLEIAAMIDRDSVKPRAERRIATKLIHLPKSFQKDIVRRILGFVRIAQKS